MQLPAKLTAPYHCADKKIKLQNTEIFVRLSTQHRHLNNNYCLIATNDVILEQKSSYWVNMHKENNGPEVTEERRYFLAVLQTFQSYK